jgi:hypothetical protein
MTEGEYRSHIYFRAVPDEKPLGEENGDDDESSIGIRLTPIFGITIPAIIRVGDVSANVTISSTKLNKEEGNPPLLQMVFNREGNQSVYGDLTVEYEAQGTGRINVGNVRGLAIYTPNKLRNFRLQLDTPDGVDYTKGKLIIRYSSSNDAKPELFTEKEISLF